MHCGSVGCSGKALSDEFRCESHVGDVLSEMRSGSEGSELCFVEFGRLKVEMTRA